MVERVFDFVVAQLSFKEADNIGAQIHRPHFENTVLIQSAGVKIKENRQHTEFKGLCGTFDIVAIFAQHQIKIESADGLMHCAGGKNAGAGTGRKIKLRE